MTVRSLLMLIMVYVVGTSGSLSFPEPPMPYSTTLLRTHHYAQDLFLSVGELLSVKKKPDGHTWEAYMIEPGWPFDLRDDPVHPTIVLGLRVVYEYTSTNYTIWYYATNLDGVEECILYGNYAYRPFSPSFLGTAIVRGIETDVWNESDTTGTNTTYYLTKDLGDNMYPFRIHVIYPEGSSEVEWVLDHGTHYAVLQDKWFSTLGCNEGTHRRLGSRLPSPHNPWSLFVKKEF